MFHCFSLFLDYLFLNFHYFLLIFIAFPDFSLFCLCIFNCSALFVIVFVYCRAIVREERVDDPLQACLQPFESLTGLFCFSLFF